MKARTVSLVALVLALFVALREAIYFLDHPGRSGPAAVIVALAIAVVLLAVVNLRKSGQ